MAQFPEIYREPRYKAARMIVIQRDMGLCQRCMRLGKTKPGKHCHHMTHLTAQNKTNPAIAFNSAGMELLCNDCHDVEHERNSGLADFTAPIPPG